MALHRLGKSREARDVLATAAAWMREHAPDDEELARFQSEATAALAAGTEAG